MLKEILRFFGLPRVKKGFNFTDEHRQKALEIIKRRAALKLLELDLKEKELQKRIKNADKETPEEMVNSLITSFIQQMLLGANTPQLSSGAAQVTTTAAAPPLPADGEITEDTIKSYLRSLPLPVIRYLQDRPEEELRQRARSELGFSEDKIDLAIKVIKEWE